MTRSVVQVRLSESEREAWLAAVGPRGLSRFVRDVVNAALAERACAGETERPPSRAVVAGPLPVVTAARSASVSVKSAGEALREAVPAVVAAWSDTSVLTSEILAAQVPGVTTAARLGGVCSKSGWPVSECLCPSCKAVRLGG